MPWQTEKQTLLVKVVAIIADRLEEGSAADAEIEIAAADSTCDAHPLSPETTTQPLTWSAGCTGDTAVMAVRRIVGFRYIDRIPHRLLIRALCRRQPVPRGVNVPM